MINQPPPATILVCPAEVSWVEDTWGLILVHANRRETHLLSGIEAATWSLLALRYPYHQLLTLVAALMDFPELEAEGCLQQMLARWQSAGLLISAEQAGG